jgi:pimeloyl-ACP methyl ester carboxylesterase
MGVEALRVQFVHGLEGSPQGSKARFLAERFTALAPAMDTGDFEACVAVQADALASFRPDVLVGSSFGGAVALVLLQRGLWRGPTLLLAPAVRARGLPFRLPAEVPVWLVHGLRDALIDIEDSRELARAGTPELVRLIEVDDDHPLRGLVASGRLAGLVRGLHEAAPG